MSGHLICPNCGYENSLDRALCTSCSGALVAPSNSSSSEPGRYLGRMISQRYRVVERLARGGMGEVYIAEHAETRQLVAVKFLHKRYAGDASFAARFFNEARYASQVTHPNAVATYDFGRLEDGTLFLVMEYVRGQSLRRVVRAQGIIPVHMAVRITSQVAEVLASAHEKKIIHRDVKPDNIMLVQGAGGRVSVKVLDFGIAKILDDESGHHTEPGVMFGTPEYMSPEQALGKPYDHRVDIYALGLVLYYMLAGNPPFRSKNKMAVLQQQAKSTPESITRVSKQPLPKALVDLIDAMLSKMPDDRPSTMVEVLERLDGVLSDPALEAEIISMESMPISVLSDGSAPASQSPSQRARVTPPPAAVGRVHEGEEYTAISRRNDDPSLAPIGSESEDPYHFTRPITRVQPLSLSQGGPDDGVRTQTRERAWVIALIVALCTGAIILALPLVLSKNDSAKDDVDIAEPQPHALEDDALNDALADESGTGDDAPKDDPLSDKDTPENADAANTPSTGTRHAKHMERAKNALNDGDLGEMRAALSAIPTTDQPDGFKELRGQLLRAESLSADIRGALERKDCGAATKAADSLASEFGQSLASPYRGRIEQCTTASAAAAKAEGEAKASPPKSPSAAQAPPSQKPVEPKPPVERTPEPPAKAPAPPAKDPEPTAPAAAAPAPRALPDDVSTPSKSSSTPAKPSDKPAPDTPKPPTEPVDVLPPMEL